MTVWSPPDSPDRARDPVFLGREPAALPDDPLEGILYPLETRRLDGVALGATNRNERWNQG